MSDMPERIWLDWPGAKHGEPIYTEPPERDTQAGQTEYVRADIVQALTAERNKAVLGNHRFNEHEPTWAGLTSDWKARAEAAEGEAAALKAQNREMALDVLASSGQAADAYAAQLAAEAERDRLREALTDAGVYLNQGLDKMAFNIIRAALKGKTP